MLSGNPRSSFSPSKRPANSGFTLIELLMVIAVIGILAGITFGITKGVKNAQNRAVAKAELASLAQAMEQFKLRYGDYPLHDSDSGDYPGDDPDKTNSMLLYALTGRVSIKGNATNTAVVVELINEDLDHPDVKDRPKFIDITKFDIQDDLIMDPWGHAYKYWYKWEATPNDWEVFGFHLFSLGADGEDDPDLIDSQGVMDSSYRDSDKNIDNIFTGE